MSADEDMEVIGIEAIAPPVLRLGDLVRTPLGDEGVLVGMLRTAAGLELWVSHGHSARLADPDGKRREVEVAACFTREEVQPHG